MNHCAETTLHHKLIHNIIGQFQDLSHLGAFHIGPERATLLYFTLNTS